jgi:2-haloacid dehalogenase
VAHVLDFDAFDLLTFDCYGTLIDWERGILDALAPIFAAHGVAPAAPAVLEAYGELESAIEAGEYEAYRVVLSRVLEGLGARFGFSPSAGERESFSVSVGAWPAFPDAPGALRALKSRYALAVISNVDDDLFARSAIRLEVPFDWVVTAQQVRSYKPSLETFRRAFERIGVPPARLLHVAQSLFHDIAPARRLGMATVWVNRRRGQAGPGATPPASAVPDLEVAGLDELAERALRRSARS